MAYCGKKLLESTRLVLDFFLSSSFSLKNPQILQTLTLEFPPNPTMLLSPGHSPRHISTPNSNSNSNTSRTPNPNPNPNSRKRGPSVLDEDSYVAAIEQIIERDFFPDLPKLRDRLDWLEALRSHDPVLIRDAQLQILDRRRQRYKTLTQTTPSSQRSHLGGGFSATPFGSEPTPSQNPVPLPTAISDDVTNCDLDDFFRRYTSEDNESFNKILEKVNRKRKERFSHLLEGEKEQTLAIEGSSERDRITDGYGTSGQPVSTLDGWEYTAKNLLMYNPSDKGEVPLTEEERAVRLKGLTKEISKPNTRLHGKDVGEGVKEEEGVEILYNMVPGTTPAGAAWPFADRDAEKGRKYDLEDLKKTPNPFFVESGKKAENGYSFVSTPSPAPGVDESPFMTWGEIDGTPLRLDLDESSIGEGGSSERPHFRIPLPPTRDVKAHSLSREAARKLRDRSQMFRKPPLPLPSPARGGSASPSVRTLSPAAQKFVRNAIAKSSRTVDETLRASYRGSSPVVETPKEKMTRFSRDGSLGSKSPSARPRTSSSPW